MAPVVAAEGEQAIPAETWAARAGGRDGCASHAPATGWRSREEYLRRLGISRAVAPARRPEDRPVAQKASQVAPGGPAGGQVAQDKEGQEAGCQGQRDFRVNFLRKLSYSKVWVPAMLRPPKHQTVIIFDWDDTLLCTSFLASTSKGQKLSEATHRALAAIERVVGRLLETAVRLGQTFIITNAGSGWVEYSAAAYMPGILPLLRAIPVVSARAKYEPEYPGDVGQWKVQAFLELQRKLDTQVIANLISIGDSNFEMDAVHTMGQQFTEALTKTVKFAQNPSPEELVKQLELVDRKFERIVVRASNLQVGLERRAGAAARAA